MYKLNNVTSEMKVPYVFFHGHALYNTTKLLLCVRQHIFFYFLIKFPPKNQLS